MSQDVQTVKRLGFDEQFEIEKPLAISSVQDGNIVHFNQVVLAPENQNQYYSNVPNTALTGMVASQALRIPFRSFKIPIDTNSILCTQNAEITIQCDLAVTSTVGAELNP